MKYKYTKKEMLDFIGRAYTEGKYELAKTYILTYAGKTFSASCKESLLKGLENAFNHNMLLKGGLFNA